MRPGLLQPADRDQIAALGMAEDDVLRQLELFSDPPPFAELVRPCRIGDGVAVVPEEEQPVLLRLHDEAARAGRLLKFVPASGAASRMFQSLARYVEDDRTSTFADVEAEAARGGKAAREVVRFVESLEKLPFRDALAAAAGEEALADPKGRFRDLITALLSPSGLAYGAQPKGLIPFHREEEGPRTAFEEHLVEGALTVRDGDSRVRIHFTVPDHAGEEFTRLLERHRPTLESRLNSRFEASFSIQDRSTDTVAVDLEDRPFRLADGTILFRPGGHGALLKNLADLPGADVVFVKNIDNVVPDARKGPTLLWKKLLAGTLLRLERRIHHLVRMLEEEPEDPAHVAEALGFLSGELGCAPPAGTLDGLSQAARAAAVCELLDRPLRVCGVVRNEGEPGGGPFWVRDSRGVVSPQIVESSQVDPASTAQQAIWGSSTHFNPVDLVLGLRRASGQPHDLPRHVDPATVFISRKSRDGRELKALERPGLWNGAMARWLTLFVEVPIATFAPVKTVLDLTRPEHQPG